MRSVRTRWWRAIAALLAIALLAAACGDDDGNGGGTGDTGGTDNGTTDTTEAADVGEPQYGGRVVMALEAESDGFIPGLTATGTSTVSVDAAIFDALVVVDSEGEFQPWLAESIESNDDLTEWTITLRPGIEFHDGTPLDAEAMLWNFENLHQAEGSLTASALTTAGIGDPGMVVDDELTFTYQLAEANAAFPDLLAGRIGMPISPTAFEELGQDAFGAAPVGTGPFVVQSWQRDDRMVLDRNENYWMTDEAGNSLPYLDGIEFRPIPDEDSRLQTWLSDDAQILQTNRGQSGKNIVEQAESGPFEANAVMGNIAGASIFNTLQAPVDDIRVREAMILAASSDDVAGAQGYDGITSPASQFVNPDSPWFSTEAEDAYLGAGGGADIEAATERLQEYIDDPDRSDGRAPGERPSLRYQCPPDPSLLAMATVLLGAWDQIGIDVELVQVEQPTLISNVLGLDNNLVGTYDVSCWRVGSNDDPLAYVANYFGPVETTVSNFVNFSDPEIDEQLDILQASDDFGERYSALERINVIANENSVTAWHISYVATTGWREDLRGVDSWVTPDGIQGRSNVAGLVMPQFIWIDE
ncbi:MAG: ABC transporter substrate-binding protein [Acidimicrobiales bacterium]